MGSEASSMITMWIPLGDYPVHQGTLMVLRGSNSQPEFQNLRQTYGSSRVGKDGVQSGWLTEDPNELLTLHPEIPPGKVQWDTADVNAGDVIILSLDALHCSTTNTTNELRISCDTRWHVASEKSSFATSRKTL
jgi:ectoine hydroxylase-related dioxygenase (phytanoyl-CoA dioxygenase family)